VAFGIFAAFAEFERELIAERTQAGLAAARARGRMGGRPRKMDRATLTMAMAAMSDPKANEVARRLFGQEVVSISRYRQILQNGTSRPSAQTRAASSRMLSSTGSRKA